jgi:hypothetical protein
MKNARIIDLLLLTFLTMSCTGLAAPPEEHPTGAIQGGDVQRQDDLKSRPCPKNTEDHVSGQVLVKFKEGTQERVIEAIERELHLQTIRVVSRPNLYLMKIQDGLSMEETIRRLQESKAVEYAEPNLIRTIQ